MEKNTDPQNKKVEETLSDLENDKLLGISMGEILEGIESEDEEVRKQAHDRLQFIQKQVEITRQAQTLPSHKEEALKFLKDVALKGSALANPASVLERGIVYTAETVPEINREEQLQQVGIDLRLAKAYRVVGRATLSLDKSKTVKPDLVELQATDGKYLFKAGQLYSIDFMEDVKVPEDLAGIVKHRSTINRTIGTIESGIYDPGFESSGGCGAVFRPNTDVTIDIGFRCAQILFFTATSANLYNGQYQRT